MSGFDAGRDNSLRASETDELRAIASNFGLLGAFMLVMGRGAASEHFLFVGNARALGLAVAQLAVLDHGGFLARNFLAVVPSAAHGRDAVLPVHNLAADVRAQLFTLVRLGCPPVFWAEFAGPLHSEWGPRIQFRLSEHSSFDTVLGGTLSNTEYVTRADAGLAVLEPALLPAGPAPAKAHLARRLARRGITDDLTTELFRALALVLTGYAVSPSTSAGDNTLTLTWGLFHPHELHDSSLPNMDLGTARLADIVGRAQAALAAISPNLLRAVSYHLELIELLCCCCNGKAADNEVRAQTIMDLDLVLGTKDLNRMYQFRSQFSAGNGMEMESNRTI